MVVKNNFDGRPVKSGIDGSSVSGKSTVSGPGERSMGFETSGRKQDHRNQTSARLGGETLMTDDRLPLLPRPLDWVQRVYFFNSAGPRFFILELV
jgi:hypothetical protein